MKLHEFTMLTDENIHSAVLADLRSHGCDVLDVRESGLIGSSDLSLIRLAYSQNRVIFTHDSDFGKLAVAQLKPLVGLIFLRPGHIDPHYTLQTLSVLFRSDLALTPPFIIVAKRTGSMVHIRLRHL